MRTGLLAVSLMLLPVVSCTVGRKLARIQDADIRPSLAMSEVAHLSEVKIDPAVRDTMTVKDGDGRDIIIMRAVKDENGEMVATEQIVASFVEASFKNVAERHGKADLRFRITVPQEMMDGNWQLRLNPVMHINGKSSRLDSILITGDKYRRAQMRGYQQYERFLESISRDSLLFVRKHDLEVFIERNLPQLFAFKNDTSYVSDEEFASYYGVTEREAIEHYTNWLLVKLNRKKLLDAPRRFRKYVKVPIVDQGLRLDTIIRDKGGALICEYVQTISAGPNLRKAQITMPGAIYEEDRMILNIPVQDTLSFYISSLSSLVDNTEKYLFRIVERRVDENSVCWIEFKSGSYAVDPDLGNNASEIGRVKDNLRQILADGRFILDSTIVSASCSPEGSYQSNSRLSQKRSESVCCHFQNYATGLLDSLAAELGTVMDMDGKISKGSKVGELKFVPQSIPENWAGLESLIRDDAELAEAEKQEIMSMMDVEDPDKREKMLSGKKYYRYLRQSIYPHLRTVKFSFVMHRPGMLKDTIHTTELDTAYMRGVQAIRDRDYEKALGILRPYSDLNTAIAYCSLDYNASAMAILEKLPTTPKSNYIKALIHSRNGETQKAVQCYLDACREDPMLIHRGNLDPEISELIRKYDLFNQP